MLVARAADPKVDATVGFGGLVLCVREADALLPASGNSFLLRWADDLGDIIVVLDAYIRPQLKLNPTNK